MSYSDSEVFAATSAMDKYRSGEEGEAGSALVVVDLSARGQPRNRDSATTGSESRIVPVLRSASFPMFQV
jgi:hypothetical protein